jgi:16S rRNA (guanine966-N2)-methyltransferase
MRVIAGTLKGRQFNSPGGHRTHPMSDKIRGAIFNILGDIKGLTVVDAFAGSGALCFEAISRGAKSVLAIELDKIAVRTIKENIELLGVEDRVTLLPGTSKGWSNRHKDLKFDLVLCDPPYDKVQIAHIQKLVNNVTPSGLLVLSWPSFLESPELVGMEQIRSNVYGNARVVFFRRQD